MTWGIFGDLSDSQGLWRGGREQRTHDRPLKTIDQPRAFVGDHADLATLAGFEAHSSSRRNVQAASAGNLSIKGQSRVGFRQVIVTSDLDRPIARVGHMEGDGPRIRIQDDLTRCGENLARYHVTPRSVPAHRER
jgi:hypothetical protein